MAHSEKDHFSSPPQVIEVNGLLFDLDGTIIDSTDAIVKHWYQEAAKLGMDPEEILATSHGRRSIDTFAIICPSKANWEYVNQIEYELPRTHGKDAVVLPGSRELLESLDEIKASWAVVTSGTRGLVDGWIEVLDLAHPKNLVTAQDVSKGKPDPECYLLGRDKLGLEANSKMVVVEDAPSGIRAGKAAGFSVIGLTTTHTSAQVAAAGADWIVQDLRSVRCKGRNGSLVQIEISDALVQSSN